MQEARDLIEGKFIHAEGDEPEEIDLEIKVGNDGENVLGRAMLNGAPNDPQHELNLDGFD